MSSKEPKGEGNRKADRRYREGVRKTVESTTEEQREQLAGKPLSKKERESARMAEEKGKSRARH
jgi:hypothetical protein